MTRRELLLASMTGTATTAVSQPGGLSCDVCVYGATPGGIAAAVSAARMGRSVVLIEYEDHIGGIVSNGLTNADIVKRQAVGGLYYEFTRRVVRYYENMDRNNPAKPNVKACRDGYHYEASLAERLFHEMIAEQGARIRVLLRHELKKAVAGGGVLTNAVFQDLNARKQVAVRAKAFVDATYEGDLAAMAGAPFRTGREARAEYNEPHAGRIYMRFRTDQILEGSTGEADNATQAFCFRFHVTNVPANRIPIEKPETYDRDDYHFLLQDILAGRVKRFRDAVLVIPMPNGKYELLNAYGLGPNHDYPTESLDLAEENWSWPTASPAERARMYRRYRDHNVGLIWFLQNDPEVTADLRADARQYGWCRDEWPGNKHIPRQVYVRQGRRILGDYVLTERDGDLDAAVERTRIQPTSIGVVEWPFDPHAHHKYDGKHPGVREGYFMVPHPPFQIPYGVIVPKKIEGLLVPVACSCSHVAYNALRMEPVFMALGEASGIAAHLAIERSLPLRRVPPAELQRRLVERKGVIAYLEDVPFDHPCFPALQWLGARGLNRGYLANPVQKLTEGEGWAALGRVLASEGRKWQAPAADSSSPLTAKKLLAQLRSAGYSPAEASSSAEQQLTVAQAAVMIFEAMTGA